MRPANDPNVDYKALVERGYDACGAAYSKARAKEQPGFDLLAARLSPGARVLDVGCGAGVPVARALAERFAVTGVDISAEQIQRARHNVPGATFVQSDVMAVDFPAASFDAVVAFYTIFHLPREEHEELFRRIHRWLEPRGHFLATVTIHREDAYTEDHFFGATMYWSNFGLADYERMLVETGFEVVETGSVGHGYDQGRPERHPLILART